MAIFDPKFGLTKEDVIRRIKGLSIDLCPFFYLLISEPAYTALPVAHTAQKRNTMSYRISPYGVNLPCGMNMTCERVNYVCDAVKKVVDVE